MLEIRVITSRSNHPLLEKLRTLFPYASVEKLEPVDHSSSTPELLLEKGLIGVTSLVTMKEGRRWHHEVAKGGAVGLAESIRAALSLNPALPLLVLEDDCVVRDGSALKERVESLLLSTENFEMAVLGGLIKGKRGRHRNYVEWGKGPLAFFETVTSPFWFMHCVLYTPKGRRVVRRLLEPPLDMQVDSFLGYMAHLEKLRIVCEEGGRVVYQGKHVSSIQENGVCLFCSNVESIRRLEACAKVVLILQTLAFVYFFIKHSKTKKRVVIL